MCVLGLSRMQGAFVPRRLITNNFLVAYECFHSIKNKRTGSMGTCEVKLHMHKAYAMVEWNFLEMVMLQLGFLSD